MVERGHLDGHRLRPLHRANHHDDGRPDDHHDRSTDIDDLILHLDINYDVDIYHYAVVDDFDVDGVRVDYDGRTYHLELDHIDDGADHNVLADNLIDLAAANLGTALVDYADHDNAATRTALDDACTAYHNALTASGH